MKKISTKNTHFEQINLSLAYINSHYSIDIKLEELAKISGYSLFHFHRIFKTVTGEKVHDYIKNTRLEKASNLLIYNQHKKIQEIALECGFSTATGFGSAFKKRFNMTPKEWRKVGFEIYDKSIKFDRDLDIGLPEIINTPILYILYLRVYGYKSDMSEVWNKINTWWKNKGSEQKDIRYIGVFHNHPSSLPYDNARYLACINIKKDDMFRSGEIGRCRILDGLFAKFSFKCFHKELYLYMQYVYIKWLRNSDYELRNFPSYVEYKNPDDLLQNGILDVDFYVPIKYLA